MPSFSLAFTVEAKGQLERLRRDRGQVKRLKAVRKPLGYLEADPRHPGLQTHEFRAVQGLKGEKVFEAYAEQRTPAAYRVFWHYGPEEGQITIVAITSHP